MSSNNGRTIKIIGLILTGSALLGSALASHYSAKEDAKIYTDGKVSAIASEIDEHAAKDQQNFNAMTSDISRVREDVSVIKSILEYHFSPPRKQR